MSYVAAVAILLFAVLVQSLLGPSLPLVGGRPDAPLVVVLAWAMLRGSNEGAAVGFVGGLLLDTVSYTPFGVGAALLGLTGYVIGLAETNLYRGNVPFFLGTTAAMSLLYHTAEFLLLQGLGLAVPSILHIYQAAIPAAVLNAVLVLPTFLVCRKLLRGLDGWRQMQV